MKAISGLYGIVYMIIGIATLNYGIKLSLMITNYKTTNNPNVMFKNMVCKVGTRT